MRTFQYDYYKLAAHPVHAIGIVKFMNLMLCAGLRSAGYVPFTFNYRIHTNQEPILKHCFVESFGFWPENCLIDSTVNT